MSGPITIFDKSFLQMLNIDEACLFGHFYSINMPPIFFVETLSNLAKETTSGTPEQRVGALAAKTANMSAWSNALHTSMARSSLEGHPLPVDRQVPAVAHGRSVLHGDRAGLVYRRSDEEEACGRWQQGRFEEIERDFARNWRESVRSADQTETYRQFRAFLESVGKPKALVDCLRLVDELMDQDKQKDAITDLALTLSEVPPSRRGRLRNRWFLAGRKKLRTFAPYAAHVVRVHLFHRVAMGADLISKDRPSHQTDVAYLNYLPFCMAFVSNDKLHRDVAPLFLTDSQVFIWGADLKADLAALCEHYSQLPTDVLETGLYRFAQAPPDDDRFLTTRLARRFTPGLDLSAQRKPISAEETARIVRELQDVSQLPTAAKEIGLNTADFVAKETLMPVRMGKWRIMPPGTENQPQLPPFRRDG